MSAPASADSFYIYILRCVDGTLYVGHTCDVQQRVKTHSEGRGARWTACRLPIELVYQEVFPTEQRAIVRERQIKRWTHTKKLALIQGDIARLKSLAKRRVT